MDNFFKMDVFFVITTAAVIIVGILLAVLIIYIIKISRDIKYISQKARTETDLISQDLTDLRDNIKTQGAHLKYFASFFKNLGKKSKKEKK